MCLITIINITYFTCLCRLIFQIRTVSREYVKYHYLFIHTAVSLCDSKQLICLSLLASCMRCSRPGNTAVWFREMPPSQFRFRVNLLPARRNSIEGRLKWTLLKIFLGPPIVSVFRRALQAPSLRASLHLRFPTLFG